MTEMNMLNMLKMYNYIEFLISKMLFLVNSNYSNNLFIVDESNTRAGEDSTSLIVEKKNGSYLNTFRISKFQIHKIHLIN